MPEDLEVKSPAKYSDRNTILPNTILGAGYANSPDYSEPKI